MINKRLLEEVKTDKKSLALVIGFGFGTGLLAILQAGMLSHIINGVFLEGQKLKEVINFLWFLLFIMALRSLWGYMGEIFALKLAGAIKSSLRQRLYRQIKSLGPVHFKGEETGELVNLLTESMESLDAYFSRYLPQLALSALIPLTILAWVFPLDLISACILLFTAPLIPFFMFLIGRWAESAAKKQFLVLSRLSAHFLNVIKGLTTLKLFNRSRDQIKVIEMVSDDYRHTTLGVMKIAFLSALALELLTTLSTALVAVTVGLRLLSGKMLFQESFFLLLLAPEFYLPLRLLGSHFHAGLGGVSAAERIFHVLDLPLSTPEVNQGKVPLERGESILIEFSHVSYTYPEENCPALNQVSFRLKPGRKTLLAGANGAGKTTTAMLLLGFIRPEKGEIFVNHHSLNSFSREEWRKNIAYISQHPYIFSGTVADNIKMGSKAERSQVLAAAKQCGADDFIKNLPHGYVTLIGDGGRTLSGGQRQLIAVARALLKDPVLVIMDEPHTGLDQSSQELAEKALSLLSENRTSLIIAHDMKSAEDAHEIILLDQGQVVSQGSHQELLETSPLYREMVMKGGGI